MTLKVQLVIFSHLSDIQTGVLSQEEINDKINFVKALVSLYPNTYDKVTDEELNRIWEKYITNKK